MTNELGTFLNVWLWEANKGRRGSALPQRTSCLISMLYWKSNDKVNGSFLSSNSGQKRTDDN